MKEYKLAKTPTMSVKIDSKTYQVAANATAALLLGDIEKQMAYFENLDDQDKLIELCRDLADNMKRLVVMVYGDKGYKALLEGHELDIYRIVSLINITSEIYASPEMGALLNEIG